MKDAIAGDRTRLERRIASHSLRRAAGVILLAGLIAAMHAVSAVILTGLPAAVLLASRLRTAGLAVGLRRQPAPGLGRRNDRDGKRPG